MIAPLPTQPRRHGLGHVFETNTLTVFFGDERSNRDALATSFPDFQLCFLKQTHSDIVVESPSAESREADAHLTDQHKIALCIQTADCIPIMIYDPETEAIAAIHAGWRGVELEIIQKTCGALIGRGSNLDRARAWIGPHIGFSSFEVGVDVATRLESRFDAVRGHSRESTALRSHESESEKRYVNLIAIARAQLASKGISPDRVAELLIDTVTSPAHCSFRRDRERAGRQISFIAFK